MLDSKTSNDCDSLQRLRSSISRATVVHDPSVNHFEFDLEDADLDFAALSTATFFSWQPRHATYPSISLAVDLAALFSLPRDTLSLGVDIAALFGPLPSSF